MGVKALDQHYQSSISSSRKFSQFLALNPTLISMQTLQSLSGPVSGDRGCSLERGFFCGGS